MGAHRFPDRLRDAARLSRDISADITNQLHGQIMPGLIGFTRRGGDGERAILERMQEMLWHQPFYIEDRIFGDAHLLATRTHKGIVQKEAQPFINDGVHVWFKGEFYNQDALLEDAGPGARGLSDPALLLRMYRNDRDFGFLRRIDGIYSAVLYDVGTKTVHLITDRYGLSYLYWTIQGDTLLWASEMKSFLAHPRFEPTIDRETLEHFLSAGYPYKSKTWFEDVELVPAGGVLSWELHEKRLRRRTYWSWSDIRPLTGPIDEEALTEEVGRLWIDSVRRRSGMGGGRIGLSLSGGRDSRAILAALPELGYPIHAMTVGNSHCDDVRIARKAADVRGAEHHVFHINGTNWLDLRKSGIWWSDGHIDLMHMHGCVVIDKLRQLYDINMSGIVALIGGDYVDNVADRLSTRGRRFAPSQVQTIDDIYFHSRLPFFDNALVERVLSIPGVYRADDKLYNRMLLQHFPSYYRRIPWQATGLPIGHHPIARRMKNISDYVSNFTARVMRKVGFERLMYVDNRNFHNYPLWLRMEPGRSFVTAILESPSALYGEFVDRNEVLEKWQAHLSGRNRARRVCQALTFEIWLQQVYEGRFRGEGEVPGEVAARASRPSAAAA